MTNAQRLIFFHFKSVLPCLIISSTVHAEPMLKKPCESASIEIEQSVETQIENDLAAVTLFAEIQDMDAGKSSAKGNELLNKQIKKISSDKVKLGNHTTQISTTSQYNGEGRPNTWKTRIEVTLESQDFTELSKIVVRLTPDLAYESIKYRLSHSAFKNAEQRMIRQAIEGFREKANLVAESFGYKNHQIKYIQIVSTNANNEAVTKPMFGPKAMLMSSAVVTPVVESGKSNVRVTVRGSITVE